MKAHNFGEARWMQRIQNILLVIMSMTITSSVILIVFAAGGYKTTQDMAQMKNMMGKMTTSTESLGTLNETLVDLSTNFPKNQMEVTTKQVFGMIQNAYLLTSRAKFLTDDVKPTDIGTITNKIAEFVSNVSPGELSSHVDKIVKQLDAVIAHIDPDAISKVLKTASEVDMTQLNKFVDRVNKLHEIKIDFP